MKKYIGLALFVSALSVVCGIPSASASVSGSAVVTRTEGTASILRGGESVPAAVGTALQKDDVLVTGEDGGIDVSLNGRAGVRMLASSQSTLDSIETSAMRVHVKSGNAIMNLEKLSVGTSFEFETPTAIAAVRGTQFWGRVDLRQAENPVTTFAVREGTVEVLAKASEQTYTLTVGQALDIPKDTGSYPAIREALAAEMNAMEQASSIRTSA